MAKGMVCVICSKHEHIGSFITRCPNYKNKMMPQIKLRSIDVMIRKLDFSSDFYIFLGSNLSNFSVLLL
jgi:hypothetical protein